MTKNRVPRSWERLLNLNSWLPLELANHHKWRHQFHRTVLVWWRLTKCSTMANFLTRKALLLEALTATWASRAIHRALVRLLRRAHFWNLVAIAYKRIVLCHLRYRLPQASLSYLNSTKLPACSLLIHFRLLFLLSTSTATSSMPRLST